MTDSTRLLTALMYAGAGLLVVPFHGTTTDGHCTCDNEDCDEPGNHAWAPNRLDDASKDPVEVREWWTTRPKARIAMRTGAPDIIAVTVVEREQAALQAVEGDFWLHQTVEIHTKDSRIYLYKAPPDDIPGGEVKLAEGVMALGKYDYVIMPSRLEGSDDKRHFAPGKAMDEVAFAPASRLLLSRIREREFMDSQGEAEHSERASFRIHLLDMDWIATPKHQTCDPEKTKLHAESMLVTGYRTPPTVRLLRLREGRKPPRFVLLSDPHQLEAMKLRGVTTVQCVILEGTKADARLWQIAQLILRPDVSVLDWAELVMEWVRRVREKDGHDAHPEGGKQPHDKGLSEAERVLGISRRDLQRAEQICSICDQAKQEIRKINLNVRKAILKVASEPIENQVAKVHELADAPKRAPAADPSAEAGAGAGAGAGAAAPAPERAPAPPPTRPEADPAQQVQQDGGQVAEHPAGRVQESPPTVPDQAHDDLAIPPALDRTNGEQKLAAFKARWSEYCQPAWRELPAVMQARFVEEDLGYRGVGKVGKNSG